MGGVHPALTQAPAGQRAALSKVDFGQHSDGVLTHVRVQHGTETPPQGSGTPLACSRHSPGALSTGTTF